MPKKINDKSNPGSKSTSDEIPLKKDDSTKSTKKKVHKKAALRSEEAVSSSTVTHVEKVRRSTTQNNEKKRKHGTDESTRPTNESTRYINLDPKYEWLYTELRPYRNLIQMQVRDGIHFRKQKDIERIFMVHEVDRVWYAYYKHDNKAKMCNGFMRMQSNSEKKQSSSKDAVLKYWILQGKVDFWFGKKQVKATACQMVKIPKNSLYGIVNQENEVALLQYCAMKMDCDYAEP